MKAPYTERYVRCCERTAVSHRLLLDCATIKNNLVAHRTIFLSVLHVLCEKILETMRIAYKNYTKYNKIMAKVSGLKGIETSRYDVNIKKFLTYIKARGILKGLLTRRTL